MLSCERTSGFVAWGCGVNAMEKEMPSELEKALQEIEQLRQENSQLRKKLGIEVSEATADYIQSGSTCVGSNTRE
jgi:cell shape-determining protein MreC